MEAFSEILSRESIVKNHWKLIIGYISGWVATKLVKTLQCETCVNSLLTQETLHFHKFITKKDMGGLCYPSQDVYQVCFKCQTHIRNHFKTSTIHLLLPSNLIKMKTKILQSFVSENLFSSLDLHAQEQPPTFNHCLQLIRAIIDKYVSVRVQAIHKNDPNTASVAKRQKRNKLNLYEGH